ncbi:MAG: AsmA family protein, partial [Gammaproteobacteria bacterium]|nr:AsmA family protein [Gammaproteobacteria bacterium]
AFSFSGPDTMHVAEVFGIDGVVDAPFQISGHVAQEGSRFQFSETRAQLGDNAITINGWIDTRNTIPDGDISIKASGPNFSVIGPFTGISGIPAETFQIDGRIKKIGTSVSFDDVKIAVGENRITAKGAFAGRGSDENEITFSASGPDMSMLQAMTGLQGIPGKPFTISAHLRPDKAGFKLEDATGVFGDNRVEVNGVVGTKRGLTGTDLRVKISGSDLTNVAVLARVPYLPAGPFKVAGHIQIKDDLLSIKEATAVTEGFDASARGTVGLGLKSGGFKLAVSASSPDLADLLQIEFLDRFAGEDFRIEGGIAHRANVFTLESVHAFIGSMEVDIDGTFASDGSTADVEIKMSAPDATVVSELSGYNDLPDGSISVNGRIEKTPTDLELGDVEFRIGDNLFTADGTLSNEPLHNDSDLRFSAAGPDLHQLGLPFGIDMLAAKAFTVSGEVNGVPTGFAIENLDAKVGENTLTGQFTADLRGKPELSGVLSSSYIDVRDRLTQTSEPKEEPSGEKGEFLFSNKALELDWLQQVNIDIDLNIDHLLVRALDAHEFKIGLKLRDGALTIDPMSFNEKDGKVSGNFHLEPSAGGVEIDASLNVENAHLGFLAFEGQDRSTMPSLNGRMELHGTGNSAHELAASANGVISFTYGAGRTRDLLGFRRLSNMFTKFLGGGKSSSTEDNYISLECAFYQVNVVNGIATTEKLAIQTDKLTLVTAGTVNLADEAIDLSIRAKPRKGTGINVLNIAKSFVKLGGTLQKPQMILAAKGSATTAGAAIATGGLSLFAKGFWDRVSSEKGICDNN